MSLVRPLIGVDFDNTLVGYDELIYEVARDRGLVNEEIPRRKQAIRDVIRQSAGGDRAWQEVQTVVYGERIAQAQVIDGVEDFLQQCQTRGIKVVVISHKTDLAGGLRPEVNLRAAAMAWMTRHRFFEPGGLGFSPADIYFESSRLEKVARIHQVGCTHFIDDLEETFLEASFSSGVEPILYRAHGGTSILPGVKAFATWRQISEYFFGTIP